MSGPEFDARVDERDANVGEDVAEHEQQRRDHEDSHHDGIVALDERLEAEQAKAVDVVDALDQERAREDQRMLLPNDVAIGMRLLRKAWPNTARRNDRPFAIAVRT